MMETAIASKVFIYNGSHTTMAAAQDTADQYLGAGHTVHVVIEAVEPLRTLKQNSRFHAMCGDIAAQRQWAGRWLGREDWKRLLVDAWTRETKRMATTFMPSLDGTGVVALGVQTRSMSVRNMAELTEFTDAWAADNGIIFSDDHYGSDNG